MRGIEVRPLVERRDEGAWIELFNSYYSRYYGSDMEPLDIEDVRWMERSPWWRGTQIFIAEVGGEAVGIVKAFVDRASEPPKATCTI